MLVETDFLLALAKPDDWLQPSARSVLDDHDDVHATLAAYTEFLLYFYEPGEREYAVDVPRVVANLVEVVPVRPDEHERAVVTAAVLADEHGLTPFDAVHAGVAIATDQEICTSERDYDDLELDRVPLEPE